MIDPRPAPIRYRDDVEQPEPDEFETIEQLNDTFREILDITARDEGRAVRGVHAKSHGLVTGRFSILPGLPPEYAQGLFAAPASHEAILRFSAIPGDILDDAISLPKGLAIKVLRVNGARMPAPMPAGEDARTQDFVLVNGPTFAAEKAEQFLGNLKLLAKTTDRAEWGKKLLSKALRPVEAGLEKLGTESPMLKQMGGAPNTHPLGETYFSQTPYRYGDYIAKFQVIPVSPELTALAGRIVDASGDPDALRHAVEAVIAEHGGEWELRVQLCRDLDTMPVEDPTVEWTAEQSPFVPVARISIPAQPGWSEAREKAVDDCMRFSVWTGLEAHRPLGGINRARRETYAMSALFRGRVNGCPMHEPENAAAVPES